MAPTAAIPTSTAFLTSYDAILCGRCATDTSDLLDDGSRWLAQLTEVPVDLLEPGDRCEECKAVLR